MILVTGGTGFLGCELLRQLTANKKSVRAIKREGSVIPGILSEKTEIEWVTADINDYFSMSEAMEGIDKIYHCAAHISFDPSDNKKMQKVNAEGTAIIVNLCLEKNIGKLLYVSSVAVMGRSKNGSLIDEDSSWESDHSSGYAFSKHEAEMEVWRAIAEGLNAVIVNPSVIIGKNAGRRGSGALFEIVRKGLDFYPSGSCGFVDVEDVAVVMISLMESDINSKRFIVNSENYTYRELFSRAALQFGLKAPAKKLRPWMLSFLWRATKALSLMNGKRYSITKSTSKSAFARQNYSNEKIKQITGINFKPVNQSIAEICAALNTSKA